MSEALDLIDELKSVPIKYYLMDVIEDKVELVFTSEDVVNNTCKMQYVRNSCEKMGHAYRVYKPSRVNFTDL